MLCDFFVSPLLVGSNLRVSLRFLRASSCYKNLCVLCVSATWWFKTFTVLCTKLIATIKLLLRRTLLRLVILLSKAPGVPLWFKKKLTAEDAKNAEKIQRKENLFDFFVFCATF
jgi:hypothetical protein